MSLITLISTRCLQPWRNRKFACLITAGFSEPLFGAFMEWPGYCSHGGSVFSLTQGNSGISSLLQPWRISLLITSWRHKSEPPQKSSGRTALKKEFSTVGKDEAPEVSLGFFWLVALPLL